jgi:hypothetical protein
MMRCAGYVALGAVALPAAMAAILTVLLGPALIAEKALGINPAWGALVSLVVVGAGLGVLFCRDERGRA